MKIAIKHGIMPAMKAYPFCKQPYLLKRRFTNTAPAWLSLRAQPRNAGQQANRFGFWLLVNSIVWLGLVACQSAEPPAVPPVATVSTAITPPMSNGEATGVITNGDRQLVVWTPEFFQPPDTTPVAVLADVYEQFRLDHPGVHLDLQIKVETGDSSLFNYLRYAQSMAPTLLPDVVLLDTEQLWQAAELGLIQAVDWQSLPDAPDFFPFARAASLYQENILGMPYSADIIHLVYHADQIEQAPLTWAELTTSGTPYLFAAGKREHPNESLLLQYVGAGGQLLENGTVNDPDALTALFTFVAQAKRQGILASSIVEIRSLDIAWSTFDAAYPGFADTSARLVLARRQTQDPLGFAPIPTASGTPLTIARTWVFAVITPDVQQQQLALDLIGQLLDPAVHSAWSRSTQQLPTQTTAYLATVEASPYTDFLQRQLDVAIAIPNGRPFADFAKRLQQAQESVLLDQLTVEDAVTFVQTAP